MLILTNNAKQCEAQECLDMFGPKWPLGYWFLILCLFQITSNEYSSSSCKCNEHIIMCEAFAYFIFEVGFHFIFEYFISQNLV